MDFKFSKNSDNSQQPESSAEKKKQSALLVLLLILVGGFAYVYFFTGIIKPQEEQKTAEAPAAAPQDVKTPLPARDGDPAKPAAKAGEKVEESKAAPAPAAIPAAVPAKPADAPAAKPAAAPAKPADAPAATAVAPPPKAKGEPAPTEAAKPVGKQPLPPHTADKKGADAVAAKAEIKKPVAESKQPVVADKKSAAKPEMKKPAPPVQAKQETAAKTKTSASDSWSLVVGNYVLEGALSADMGRVRKAGFKPVVKPAGRKKTTMNRLFVSDFNDRATAQTTMKTLKQHTSDVFVMEQGNRFAVYAGSYLHAEAANAEKDRLSAAGITATLKQVEIAIPTRSLNVGPFKSKSEAEAALGKLKSSGIKATLLNK